MDFREQTGKKMAKNTLSINQMKEKGLRTFEVVFDAFPDWKVVLMKGDEISNIDGVVEVFANGQLVAVISDYLFIQEKTPE